MVMGEVLLYVSMDRWKETISTKRYTDINFFDTFCKLDIFVTHVSLFLD